MYLWWRLQTCLMNCGIFVPFFLFTSGSCEFGFIRNASHVLHMRWAVFANSNMNGLIRDIWRKLKLSAEMKHVNARYIFWPIEFAVPIKLYSLPARCRHIHFHWLISAVLFSSGHVSFSWFSSFQFIAVRIFLNNISQPTEVQLYECRSQIIYIAYFRKDIGEFAGNNLPTNTMYRFQDWTQKMLNISRAFMWSKCLSIDEFRI